jgi:hypothetical protein
VVKVFNTPKGMALPKGHEEKQIHKVHKEVDNISLIPASSLRYAYGSGNNRKRLKEKNQKSF